MADKLFPVILVPAFIGELSTCVWLLVKGLDTAKWDERVRMGQIFEGPADN